MGASTVAIIVVVVVVGLSSMEVVLTVQGDARTIEPRR